MNRRVLFLYPPHARNTEPPLGAALLAAFLRSCGGEARVLDLNAGARLCKFVRLELNS